MTDEEMDNFVLGVVPKKTATKMQKELLDLVSWVYDICGTFLKEEVFSVEVLWY